MFAQVEGLDQYVIGVLTPLTVLILVGLSRWIKKTLQLLEQVHKMAASIDVSVEQVGSAVNSRPAGEPNIYTMVEEAARAGREAAKVGDEAAQVGRENATAIGDLHEAVNRHIDDDETAFKEIQDALGTLTPNEEDPEAPSSRLW